MKTLARLDQTTNTLLGGCVEELPTQDKRGVRFVSTLWGSLFAATTAYAGYRLGVHVTHPEQIMPLGYDESQLWGSALNNIGNLILVTLSLQNYTLHLMCLA